MFNREFYEDLKKKHIKQFYREDFEGSYDYYLDLMREYLDSVNMTMPHPKYHYDIKDMRTWKYLYTAQMDKNKWTMLGKSKIDEKLNPDFKYG